MSTMDDVRPPAAIRTRQHGSFHLPLPPSSAFDLFTAEGERRWVEGWDPVMLSSCGGTQPGAVFLTAHGGEKTIWTVIEADRDAGRLHYSRVSPGRRAGTVQVQIRPAEGGSEIVVAYDITALAPDGEQAVSSMDEAGFEAMLGDWRRLILASLHAG